MKDEVALNMIWWSDCEQANSRIQDLWDSLIEKVGLDKNLAEEESFKIAFQRVKDGGLFLTMTFKAIQASTLFDSTEWELAPLESIDPEILKRYFDIYVALAPEGATQNS